MWLVTLEDENDGTWLDDAVGFNTKDGALEYIGKAKPPPEHHLYTLYECRMITDIKQPPQIAS